MSVTWFKTSYSAVKSPGGTFHLHNSQLLFKDVIFNVLYIFYQHGKSNNFTELKIKARQVSFSDICSILNLNLLFIGNKTVYLQSVYYVLIKFAGAMNGRKKVQHGLKIKDTLRS